MDAILTFLAPYKLWIYIGLAILVAGIAWSVDNAYSEAAKVPGLEKQIKDLNSEINDLLSKCKNAQEITSTVSQKYEDDDTKRNADLNELRGLPASCLAIHSASQANGSNATDKQNQPDSGAQISSAFLINYAGECEADRIKVIALQDFINKTWDSFDGTAGK